ncbi:MAG: GDP-mannose 4,6-dehydratase [Alphaproteobacteria bacterium]|nr:GDP-mannose 4,6-dehydratase [Alphaproteobacteria bacterium]
MAGPPDRRRPRRADDQRIGQPGVGGMTAARPAGVLITGGAGFLGANLADRLAGQGRRVIVYDNLCRPGVAANLAWLRSRHGDLVEAVVADIRDGAALDAAVARAEGICHLAAQVAVTTSVVDPVTDFEVNLRGTFRLLEAIRALPKPPPLVFASTNKVYGRLAGVALERRGARWLPADPAPRALGIDEAQPLDLHSPYGCSKGAADQYVLDYARIYGLPAVVLRMSCLYGPRQFGTEDQGWVAHFLLSAKAGRTLAIFGDGAQVRDVLHVDDAVEAWLLGLSDAARLAGQPFNLGGGPGNAISLLDLIERISALRGETPSLDFRPSRPGDQLWYVSDTRRFQAATGWSPRIAAEDGVTRLHRWLAGEGVPA